MSLFEHGIAKSATFSERPIAVSGAGTMPGHWGEVCQSQSEMDKGTREEPAPEQAAKPTGLNEESLVSQVPQRQLTSINKRKTLWWSALNIKESKCYFYLFLLSVKLTTGRKSHGNSEMFPLDVFLGAQGSLVLLSCNEQPPSSSSEIALP